VYIDTKDKRSVAINVRLYQHEMEWIKAAAVMNNKSQSDIIRDALKLYREAYV
jgi:uncharacterized protein (DUF1778 family)